MGRTYRLNANGELPEAAFQQQVTNLATAYRWDWYHAPDNRPVRTRNGKVIKQNVVAGFPDLVLIREHTGEGIVAELKTERGRVAPEQTLWLARFEAVGFEAYVWRPSDFDEIQRRLARGMHRTGSTRHDGAAA